MLLAFLLPLICPPQGLELPESPAARAWAGVGPETTPVDLETSLLAAEPWLTSPWEQSPARLWKRWGEWLIEARDARTAAPRPRAGLLSIAASQERWDDAWTHFERLGGSPPWAAAMLPRLLPGIPADHPVGPGGIPLPLPVGVTLRPAIPPQLADDPASSLRMRRSSVQGLRIGQATIDFVITIEPSGVQVDLKHRSGPAVEVKVILPAPPGQQIRIKYVDWIRVEHPEAPLRVELLPGEEEHNLFGRFRRQEARLPGLPKHRLSEGILRGGLWIESGPDDPLNLLAEPFALALGQLFGFSGGIRPLDPQRPEGAWNPTVVHLKSDQQGPKILIGIASLAEGFILKGDRR